MQPHTALGAARNEAAMGAASLGEGAFPAPQPLPLLFSVVPVSEQAEPSMPSQAAGKGPVCFQGGCPQYTSRRGPAAGTRVLPQVKNKRKRFTGLELAFISPSLPYIGEHPSAQ